MGIPIAELNRIVTALEIMAGSNENGSELIDDTALHSNPYSSIVVVNSAVFTTLTGNHSNWAGKTYPTGVIITGVFSAIQLASGSVIAYRR